MSLVVPRAYARPPVRRPPPGQGVASHMMVDWDDVSRQVDEWMALSFRPVPVGYHVMALVLRPCEQIGSIIKIDETLDREQAGMDMGWVLALGPDAYGDPVKFPSGPWCKPGDVVGWQRYSGDLRRHVNGQHYVTFNDDQVRLVWPEFRPDDASLTG